MSKPITNHYKQQPVYREEQEAPAEWKPKTAQPFQPGDKVNCHFLALFFYIPNEQPVISCTADKGYVSEWKVQVKDKEGGDRFLDSSHFSLVK
jgi:hypothetical protein